jgi:hypothetical protein
MEQADLLFDAQFGLARGQTFLYKIEKYYEGKRKNRILRRKKPQLVTAQWEIEDYLENRMDEGDLEDEEATYYFLTTKKPTNQAIDSMLARTFGKAVQTNENNHHFDNFGTDDVHDLLSVLRDHEQKQFYDLLNKAIAIAESNSGSERSSNEPPSVARREFGASTCKR